ncbi:hypothetical protein TNCV_118731 [Trichonephila clavipes]|nr:hypothetical protein TNCV_118731 [Trichonephila clavipes]
MGNASAAVSEIRRRKNLLRGAMSIKGIHIMINPLSAVENLQISPPSPCATVFPKGAHCYMAYCGEKKTATDGSDVVQSGCPIFDYFFQHLWPYIGNNTANVVFQMVKRLWRIRID